MDPLNRPFDEQFRDELRRELRSFKIHQPLDGATGKPQRVASASAGVPLKRAAVTITLLNSDPTSGNTAFILTRRAPSLRSHQGQWALPGGRLDDGETAAQAALRELHEEIGLDLSADSVLGTLDDYPTRSGYLITPVIVWAGVQSELRPNPSEVAECYRIELEQINRDERIEFVSIPESPRQVIRILINGHKVHAPTAAVLYQFRELLAGRQTRVHELEQPTFAWR